MIRARVSQKNNGNNRSVHNIAYVDGQNLRRGTIDREPSWEADLKEFRIRLKDKHNVTDAYYYIGFKMNKNQSLYKEIEEAGFILVFREHHKNMRGEKKGNVDTDIVFDIMKRINREPDSFNKIILVTSDGDYYKLVQYLLEEDRLEKILFPKMRYASSLYKSITLKYFDDLSKPETIERIGRPKRKRRKR